MNDIPYNPDDPFAALQNEAAKMELERQSDIAIRSARSKLVLSKKPEHAFFGQLGFQLKLRPDWTIPTAATDGETIIYNPKFICDLPPKQQIFTFVHEIMHPASQHHTRRGSRDPKLWNLAADGIINPILVDECGFEPVPNIFYPDTVGLKRTGWRSTEELYEALKQKAEEDSPDGQKLKGMLQGGDDPGGAGQVLDAGDGSEASKTEAEGEWRVRVAQAAEVAQKRGTMPGSLQAYFEAVAKPIIDWKSFLADFITQKAKEDIVLVPPNRRTLSYGLVLPSMSGMTIGTVVALFDTSGSMCSHIQLICNELEGILMAFKDIELVIVYHDTDVAHVQKWTPADGELKAEPKGFGGTDHVPVFAWLDEQDDLEPCCILAFTDLYSRFPQYGPEAPLVWVSMPGHGTPPPWGTHFVVEEW